MIRAVHRNPALICAYHALMMSLFPMAVITLFYRREIGMTMADIFLLQGGFGLGMVLLEFPSGFVADRIGYRRSLLLASLAAILGWGLYATGHSFWQIAVAELVLGAATAFVSGSDAALLYESLKERGEEARYGIWWGRYTFVGQVAEGTAALSAGWLFARDARLPFWIQTGIWGLNFLLALALIEPARRRPERGKSLEQMKAIVHRVGRGDRQLRAFTAFAILIGLASFVPVWIIQPLAVFQGLDEAWLGPLWAAANFSVAFGAIIANRLEQRRGFRRNARLFIALIAVGYLGLGGLAAFPGFVFYFALTLMRGIQQPLVSHREQSLVPSSDRAGFLSFRSFLFRALFLLLAFPVGWALDRYGFQMPLLVLGLLLVVGSAAALRVFERHVRS
jgi:MFS family permease